MLADKTAKTSIKRMLCDIKKANKISHGKSELLRLE